MIQAPELWAHSINRKRREALMVTPSGNWWEGETKAALALRHLEMPAATSRPSSFTGTVNDQDLFWFAAYGSGDFQVVGNRAAETLIARRSAVVSGVGIHGVTATRD